LPRLASVQALRIPNGHRPVHLHRLNQLGLQQSYSRRQSAWRTVQGNLYFLTVVAQSMAPSQWRVPGDEQQ